MIEIRAFIGCDANAIVDELFTEVGLTCCNVVFACGLWNGDWEVCLNITVGSDDAAKTEAQLLALGRLLKQKYIYLKIGNTDPEIKSCQN